MARIYLASSWRNKFHSEFRTMLRSNGHEVYDFKASAAMSFGGPVATAFSWNEIDPDWKTRWTPRSYRDLLLISQRAASGYMGDLRGMEWADTCVLLLPCGRSAHLEAGYMKARSKRLIIAFPDDSREGFEPDLMYLMADHITIGPEELIYCLK